MNSKGSADTPCSPTDQEVCHGNAGARQKRVVGGLLKFCVLVLCFCALCTVGDVAAAQEEVEINTTHNGSEGSVALVEDEAVTVYDRGRIVIDSEVTANKSSLEGLRVSMNGRILTENQLSGDTNTTTLSPTYQTGNNSISVLVSTTSGAVVEETYTLTVDSTPPSVYWETPLYGRAGVSTKQVNGTNIWVNATATDVGGVEEFRIVLENNQTGEKVHLDSENGRIAKQVQLGLGETDVEWSATDGEGKTRLGDGEIVLEDRIGPALNVKTPPNTTRHKRINITGEAQDDVFVRNVTVRVTSRDEQGYVNSKVYTSVAGRNYSYTDHRHNTRFRTSVDLAEGNNTVKVTVTDYDGNAESKKYTIQYRPPVDRPPTITLTEPTAVNITTDVAELHARISDDDQIDSILIRNTNLSSGELTAYRYLSVPAQTPTATVRVAVAEASKIDLAVTDTTGKTTQRTLVLDQSNRSFKTQENGTDYLVTWTGGNNSASFNSPSNETVENNRTEDAGNNGAQQGSEDGDGPGGGQTPTPDRTPPPEETPTPEPTATQTPAASTGSNSQSATSTAATSSSAQGTPTAATTPTESTPAAANTSSSGPFSGGTPGIIKLVRPIVASSNAAAAWVGSLPWLKIGAGVLGVGVLSVIAYSTRSIIAMVHKRRVQRETSSDTNQANGRGEESQDEKQSIRGRIGSRFGDKDTPEQQPSEGSLEDISDEPAKESPRPAASGVESTEDIEKVPSRRLGASVSQFKQYEQPVYRPPVFSNEYQTQIADHHDTE